MYYSVLAKECHDRNSAPLGLDPFARMIMPRQEYFLRCIFPFTLFPERMLGRTLQ